MKKLLILAVAAGFAVGCGSQSAESYSSDLSSEMPKPRANGPDFGAYERTAPTPGSTPAAGGEAPKRLPKGG